MGGTLFLCFLPCSLEIGVGYLLWLSVRQGKPNWYAVVGSIILILYGFVATIQFQNFARVYATYGSFFIMLSLVWGYYFDKIRRDRIDMTSLEPQRFWPGLVSFITLHEDEILVRGRPLFDVAP